VKSVTRTPGARTERKRYVRKDGTEVVYEYNVASVDLGTLNGKRKRQHIRGETKTEVSKEWRKIRVERDHGLRGAGGSTLIADWFDHWLETVVRRRRDNTYTSYETSFRVHVLPTFLAGMRLDRVEPRHIDIWTSDLLKTLAPVTARRVLVVVRMAFKYAVCQGLLGRNPADADLVAPIPVERTETNPLTAEQLERLLAAVRGKSEEPLYVLASVTGMRIGELLGLVWADVDFPSGRLYVRKQMQNGKRVELKRASSLRTYGLDPDVLRVLHAQQKQVLEWKLKAGSTWAEHGLVFPTHTGRPQRDGNAWKSWKRLLVRAGLPPSVRFHDLRHTAATLALASGVSLYHVARMLGHSSVRTTADVYGHLTEEGRDETARAMAEAVLRRRGSVK